MISTVNTNNRYIVAKYAPDVRRMEPHNIGVFVWSNGLAAARFLRDKDADFVQDKETYRRWREFWTRQISGDEIQPIRGAAVPKSKPEFLDALRSTQEGNYILLDGGCIYEELTHSDIDEAADFLFDQLVAIRHPRESVLEAAHESLLVLANRLMEESGLINHDDFKQSYKIQCPIYGVPEELPIDYAIANGKPVSVYQRVSLRKQQPTLSTALIFHELVTAKILSAKKRCCSIVDSSEPNAELGLLALLNRVGSVVDVSRFPKAVVEVLAISHVAGK
jgi:hypothetical protein